MAFYRFFVPVSLDNLLAPLICITSGFLQQKFGPLRMLMFCCVPYSAGWMVAAMARDAYHLYISRLTYCQQFVLQHTTSGSWLASAMPSSPPLFTPLRSPTRSCEDHSLSWKVYSGVLEVSLYTPWDSHSAGGRLLALPP